MVSRAREIQELEKSLPVVPPLPRLFVDDCTPEQRKRLRNALEEANLLLAQLRGKIGESLKEVRDAPRLEQVTTASLPALRSYAEGLRANDIEADFPKAIALFEDAIAKDTLFAAAYVQLAHTVGNARLPRPGYRDSLITKAFTLRERLPDRERFAVEGVYYSSGEGAHRGRAITAFERAVQLDSSNADALNSLAIALTSARRFSEAERAYRAATAAEPGNNLIQANLASLLTVSGKFDEADSVYQLVRSRAPTFPAANRQFLVLYSRGDLDAADAAARAELRREGASNTGPATNFLVSLTRARGRLRESAQLAQRLSAINAAQGRPRLALFDTVDAVMVDALYRNRPEGGAARLEAALRTHPIKVGSDHGAVDPPLNAARALAIVGAPARARQVVEQVRRSATPQVRTLMRPFFEEVESEIAAAEGKPAEAIALLRRSDTDIDGLPGSCGPCLPVLLGRMHDAANQPDSVIANYERYLGTYGFARPTLDSFARLFDVLPIWRFTANSLLVVALAVPLTLLTASWAGYAMARLPRPSQRRASRFGTPSCRRLSDPRGASTRSLRNQVR